MPAKEKAAAELETQSAQPEFWQDQTQAQAAMRKLADLRRTAAKWRQMECRLNDSAELVSLAEGEGDSGMADDLGREVAAASAQLSQMELDMAFSSPYDDRNAVLSIHAGAGGTESQDWASMLLRMYLRWAEKNSYRAEILDSSPGEEAGIKSAVFSIEGDHAFGYLKSEHGVHRLVRLSPFDADHARHTSFALVEVVPEAEANVDVKIQPEDLKIEAYRSSGPGGQNVQKTSTAVRIIHLPTGIVVTSQSERSQLQNKTIALKLLETRLLEKELARQAEEKARLKGKRIEAGWGNQIRSYVLHPYKMVKDLRTDYQSGNPEAILDGELNALLTANLRAGVGREFD